MKVVSYHGLSHKLSHFDPATVFLLPHHLLLHPHVQLLVANGHVVQHQLSAPTLDQTIAGRVWNKQTNNAGEVPT